MTASAECFLCDPDASLVYLEKGPFFAMLGLGPIGEGYSLIATRQHVPSMMDLTPRETGELASFTEQVRARLRPLVGPGVITEHGRVAACVEAATATYEPHCLHAHRLVFPGLDQLDVAALSPSFEWTTWPSGAAAHRGFDWAGQYLYVEAETPLCKRPPRPAGCRAASSARWLPRSRAPRRVPTGVPNPAVILSRPLGESSRHDLARGADH